MNKFEKNCATCKSFIFKTKMWGDCCNTVIPIKLKGKQYKGNGTNCPKYEPREESRS